MDLIIVKRNSPEWEYMWSWLEHHPLNESLAEPSVALNEGESWQYLGTFRNGNRILHQFRHKHHPLTNNLKNLSLTGSESFTDESIEPKP